MIMRYALLTACVALAMPGTVLAQDEEPVIDLKAIDALFADDEVTSDTSEGAANEAEADTVKEKQQGTARGAVADEAEKDEPPETSDLTHAFNAYSLCVQDAGVALEETGFSQDVIGNEAVLRCSGERSAYFNAFYSSLLPRYPDAPEANVRESAERLVKQSDRALIAMIQRRSYRAAREPQSPGRRPASE